MLWFIEFIFFIVKYLYRGSLNIEELNVYFSILYFTWISQGYYSDFFSANIFYVDVHIIHYLVMYALKYAIVLYLPLF